MKWRRGKDPGEIIVKQQCSSSEPASCQLLRRLEVQRLCSVPLARDRLKRLRREARLESDLRPDRLVIAVLVGHAERLGTLGPERDNLAMRSGVSFHRGYDTSCRSIGNRPERIIRKMRINLGGSCLFVSEHLAHHEERIPVCYREDAKEWRRSCTRNPGSPARMRTRSQSFWSTV
jgi:hypothetical protein